MVVGNWGLKKMTILDSVFIDKLSIFGYLFLSVSKFSQLFGFSDACLNRIFK